MKWLAARLGYYKPDSIIALYLKFIGGEQARLSDLKSQLGNLPRPDIEVDAWTNKQHEIFHQKGKIQGMQLFLEALKENRG